MQDNKPLTLWEISEAAKKRVGLIANEFKNGFDFVKNYPRSVTFFGSARTKEGDDYYNKARNLARRIVSELHYSVMTGGGPGIMEAANRGAFEAGGNSLGLNIELPREQATNQYLTDSEYFHYFFSRKVCLSFSAEAYIFFPGGFGTLDEFLEILTLVQTGKIPATPIILVGGSFWFPFDNLFKEILLKNEAISEGDTSLYTITDSDDQILETIKQAPVRFGIKYNQNLEKSLPNNAPKKHHDPLGDLFKKFFGGP